MPLTCRSAILSLIFAATLGAVARAEVLEYSPRLARTSTNSNEGGDANRIDQLISQLGSDRYFDRRHAEELLIERGADVFDQLQEAEEHPDLEIATRARYILQRIRVEWTRPDDSAEVRAAMEGYGGLSRAGRLERMTELNALADGEGLGALCRIARFEPFPQLARAAALVVMQSVAPSDAIPERVAAIRQELGDSKRPPVLWLLTYCEQLEKPEQVIDRWLDLIDEEATRYIEDSAETNALFMFRMLSFHLELCRNSSSPSDILSNLSKRIEILSREGAQLGKLLVVLTPVMSRSEITEFLGPAGVADWLWTENRGELFGMAYAMNWLLENEQWEALELFEDQYEKTIRTQRLLIYLAAIARDKQGRDDLAEEFAKRAINLIADDAATRDDIGDLIGELGRHDWAEREWWFVVEAYPVSTIDAESALLSLSARLSLASLRLHDRSEDGRAAELMAEMIDALEADPQLMKDIKASRIGRDQVDQSYVQREYFLACQAANEGSHEEQRKFLEAAIDLNPEDPDVLIAMYRLENSDDGFREQTVLRIQQAVRTIEGYIEQEPGNAQSYNYWAWLVSNTEGDYDQAVEYSLRSLELSPDSPSYLDTLGRCQYAAGNLEEAVRVQREAVSRHPHLQVMRDQLELFESALAEHSSNRE